MQNMPDVLKNASFSAFYDPFSSVSVTRFNVKWCEYQLETLHHVLDAMKTIH